jgi:excinuclease UvrABC ATPase subunit
VTYDHDLDLIANAVHVFGVGPGGRRDGGRIAPTEARNRSVASPDSTAGLHLAKRIGVQTLRGPLNTVPAGL